AGVQFDLEYDSNAIFVAPAIGNAGVAAGKGLEAAVLPNGNIRIIVSSQNQTVVPDGSLVDLKIQVNPFAASGSYLLRLENVRGVTTNGERIAIDGDQGIIVAKPNK